MKFDYIFKEKNPFLALVEGKFKFENSNKIQQKELHVVKSGIISIPSGELIITDPFYLMHKENNPFIKIPPGNYQTYVTITDESENFTGEPEYVKEGYLSIIIDKEEIKNRISIQEKNIFIGNDPSVQSELLSFIKINQFEKTENNSPENNFEGVFTVSKVIGISDAMNIKENMPIEKQKPWFENFFNYDVENSWFDLMDNPKHIRCGTANIKLPENNFNKKGNFNNIIITYCGRDDFPIPAIIEYSKDNRKIIAIHLDFGVIPVYDKSPVGNIIK